MLELLHYIITNLTAKVYNKVDNGRNSSIDGKE